MRLAIAVLVTILAAPTRSDACSARHLPIFELFERAATVAYVRVVSVPVPPPGSRNPHGAGSVQLAVKRLLKGAKRSSLRTFETNTSCHIGFRRGRAALVFLDARGHTVGQEAYIEDVAAYEATIDAWAAATSDVTRRSILVDAITTGGDVIARDAAQFLLDEPGLLVKLDADQRQQLAAVTPPKYSLLPQLLGRLAGGKFESESDVSKLAATIEAGKGEKNPDRIAALDRCERVHARRLWPFSWYSTGTASHIWPKLADACRTGVPFSL